MEKRKKIIILGIVLIILFGIFLRSFHFSDWLHFELDQARDAKISLKAIQDGAGYLPLQGPRAAGSFLRLGPAFYYMQYITGKIFGANPPAMALGILFFSIFSLPLFYFFVRRYFNTRISMGLLAVFSSSLFLIMYSRFAWNPNPIPFFMLLTIYALLRVVDLEEKRKNIWMLIFSASLAIGTQLHFLVFMILPTISLIFLIIKKPKFKISLWLACLAIGVFIYSPMIINDIKTGGENTKEFFSAITEKSGEGQTHNFLEKAIRNYTEHSIGHFLIISGQEQVELPKIETRFQLLAPLNFRCDYDCRKNLPLGLLALVFFSGGLILFLGKIFDKKNSDNQKNFLTISLIWFLISLGVMTPLSFDIAPRFLVTAPLAFVFLGIIWEFSDRFFEKKIIFWTLFVALISSNMQAIYQRFWQMSSAPTEDVQIYPDRILKERARVTYAQQNVIVDYLEEFYRQNNFPIYLQSESFYARSFIYLLNEREIKQDMLTAEKIYAQGNHFLIYRTSANTKDRLGKYAAGYEIFAQKQFGTLTVFHLKPKSSMITDEVQIFKPVEVDCVKKAGSSKVQKRYTWNEIFQVGECFEEDEESSVD